MTTYNGWTNYATWRVNLELFDGLTSEIFEFTDDLPAMLKDYAKNIIEDHAKGIALDYALAFIADVNWREIADHVRENA